MDVRAPLSKANAARAEALRRRREVSEDLRSGALDLQGVIALAAVDEYVARMRIVQALTALPGWGKKRAARAIDAAGLDDRRTLGWLIGKRGARSLDALLAAVNPADEPSAAPGWPWWDRPENSPCHQPDPA